MLIVLSSPKLPNSVHESMNTFVFKSEQVFLNVSVNVFVCVGEGVFGECICVNVCLSMRLHGKDVEGDSTLCK